MSKVNLVTLARGMSNKDFKDLCEQVESGIPLRELRNRPI